MDMKRYEMSHEEGKERAEEHFRVLCGYYRNPVRFKPMIEKGMDVFQEIKEGIHIQILAKEYPPTVLSETRLTIKDQEFEASVLRKIDGSRLKKVIAYIMTAGDIHIEGTEEALLNDFFRDAWGTAYIDSGRDYFRGELMKENPGMILSDTIGPGLYGMDLSGLRKLFLLLDGTRIGVSLTERGMMKPLKSCAGFYFVLEEGTPLPENVCENCLNEGKNCTYCRLDRERNMG